MAIVPQQPRSAAHWRERALARSEVITDAWEVTKTYAGRIAEWVLFLCMIGNIIEILPGISLPPAITNTILGIQVVMLDVGGFSLASMADHARNQGDEKAARRASITGGLLIGIMIVTLLLVSIGLLWSQAKYYTDIAEKGLILVRVVMTVIYGHVIHSLRRRDVTCEQQVVQAHLQEITSQFTRQLDQVQASLVQRVQQMVHVAMDTHTHQVQTLVQQVVHDAIQHASFTTTEQVQLTIQECAQTVIAQGQTALLDQMNAHMERMTQEFKRELRTTNPTLHIVPPGGSPGSTEGSARATKKGRTLAPAVQSMAQGEPASEPPDETPSEPVSVRVTRFIQERLNQGPKPSLSEIMDQCQCSRNTAIRYRREIVGTDEEERSA
jgi:hypothetical protein